MTPQGFAIHWWDLPENKPQFYPVINLLLERGRQESASVNFVAEAGIVACLVSPTNVAWGQGDGGNGWGNLNLVSIECNPRCTAADRETVAELMADQHILNGVPLVAYPHNKFTSTQCPGVWEQHIPWLIARAKQIVASKQTPTEETFMAKLTEDEQRELLAGVREIRANVKDINVDSATGKLSLRQAIANIRSAVKAK